MLFCRRWGWCRGRRSNFNGRINLTDRSAKRFSPCKHNYNNRLRVIRRSSYINSHNHNNRIYRLSSCRRSRPSSNNRSYSSSHSRSEYNNNNTVRIANRFSSRQYN